MWEVLFPLMGTAAVSRMQPALFMNVMFEANHSLKKALTNFGNKCIFYMLISKRALNVIL